MADTQHPAPPTDSHMGHFDMALEVTSATPKPVETQPSQPAASQALNKSQGSGSIDWELREEGASAHDQAAMQASGPAPDEVAVEEAGRSEGAAVGQVAVTTEAAAAVVALGKPATSTAAAEPMEVVVEEGQEGAQEAPGASPVAASPSGSASDKPASLQSPPAAASIGPHGFKTPVSTGGKPTSSASVEAAITSPSPSPRSSVAAPDFASPDGQQSVEGEPSTADKANAEGENEAVAADAPTDKGARTGEEGGMERIEDREVEGQQLTSGPQDRPTTGEGSCAQGSQSSDVSRPAEGPDKASPVEQAASMEVEQAVGMEVEEEAADAKEGEEEKEEDGGGEGIEETAPTVMVGSHEQESETNGASQAMGSSIDRHAEALFAMRAVSVPDAPVSPPTPPLRRLLDHEHKVNLSNPCSAGASEWHASPSARPPLPRQCPLVRGLSPRVLLPPLTVRLTGQCQPSLATRQARLPTQGEAGRCACGVG